MRVVKSADQWSAVADRCALLLLFLQRGGGGGLRALQRASLLLWRWDLGGRAVMPVDSDGGGFD